MRHIRLLTAAAVMALLAACSSPQKDAAKAQEGAFEAQERVAKERLELVEKYQTCVDEAAGDQLKVDACDSYLKAAEALK
jgi:outer membrane biogenesis lipoprotein LolB